MELFLNKDIFLENYREDFKKNQKVIVKNFFISNFAELILKYLDKIPKDRWELCSVYGGNKKYEAFDTVKNKKVNQSVKTKALNSFMKREFSFMFYKTLHTKHTLNQIEFNIKKIFASQEFIDYLNYLTNENISKMNDIFISKYSKDCFLAPHCDVNNGKLAITVYLSKHWKPEYGGNLCFLNEKRNKIIETITPEFNSMTVFSIPKLTGIPHFVSHNNIYKNRYTITLWYS